MGRRDIGRLGLGRLRIDLTGHRVRIDQRMRVHGAGQRAERGVVEHALDAVEQAARAHAQRRRQRFLQGAHDERHAGVTKGQANGHFQDCAAEHGVPRLRMKTTTLAQAG
jgi:hypothetical protein